MKIGIIAEEDNDVEVIIAITAKIVPKNSFTTKKFVGHGCGKLRRKCSAWAESLQASGCDLLVVVHDLDRHLEDDLRTSITKSIKTTRFRGSTILIPVEELEAWLLSDAEALRNQFEMAHTPKIPANPEKIKSPKEYLRDLVWKMTKKRYLNTIHNKKIAERVSLERLKRCKSFSGYPEFIIRYS